VLAAVNSATTTMVTTLNGGETPYATMSNPFPNGLVQPAGHNPAFLETLEGGSISGQIAQPDKYVMQWNLTVPRDLGHGAMVQATYAASAGRRLTWADAGIVNLDQLPRRTCDQDWLCWGRILRACSPCSPSVPRGG
jgi:hypothetical protein